MARAKELFPVKKRELLAGGLMTAASLSLTAVIASEAFWKTSLNVKVALAIIILAVFWIAWTVCPVKEAKKE